MDANHFHKWTTKRHVQSHEAMRILPRPIAVYASSPSSSLSLFSVCHQYLRNSHSTVSASTMEKPSKGGPSEMGHTKETSFKGEDDFATKNRFADKIMPSILRLYGSRATARDFDIYAPFASFEDPLMCAHGVKQIKSAFYSLSKAFSESEIVEYSIEEHETSPARREIVIDNKQHYKFLGKDIEVMSLIKLYVAEGKIIRHEDWWDKKPLRNRETVKLPLLGRAIEITRRASMLATHALMGFGKDPPEQKP